MTLIVTVYVPTGIVISSDSRTTGSSEMQQQDPLNQAQTIRVRSNILISDATSKVFILFNRFGVATTGAAHVKDLPIAHYVQEFEATHDKQAKLTVQNFAQQLADYFRALQPIPAIALVVAGYDETTPHVLTVDVAQNQIKRWNIKPNSNDVDYGILRAGDTDIVDRLLSTKQLPLFQIMNVQDAVDYSRHLIRATIDQMRFEPRFPTVGGAIDTLVIMPSGARFLTQKELTCA